MIANYFVAGLPQIVTLHPIRIDSLQQALLNEWVFAVFVFFVVPEKYVNFGQGVEDDVSGI